MEQLPKTPRYELVKKAAQDFLINNRINELPFDIDDLFEKHGWCIDSVTKAENMVRMVAPFGFYSDKKRDAVTCLYRGIYITFYKDWGISNGRLYWSKAHELGHIVLKHLELLDGINNTYEMLTDDQYWVLEREAHIFSAEVLAPLAVISMCNCTTVEKIQHLCGLSKEAAGIVRKELKEWTPKDDENEQTIINLFYDFISRSQYL